MKKIISTLLLLCVVLTCLSACNTVSQKPNDNAVDADETTYKMVVLGDSIAEGILGASPISEREDHAYPSVVGNINNFEYHNRSISGFQTNQMLDYISREGDDSAYAHITHIKQADIIVISMFGNDYIFADLNKLILEKAEGKSTLADKIIKKVSTNIALIVARLKELNPNAQIMWQSLYNPIYDGSPLLLKSTYAALKAKYNISGESLYQLGGEVLAMLNQTLYDYLEKDPNGFVIVDVNKKFDEIYQANHTHLETLIYEDGIHPSNEGHAYIASALQDKLDELGYTSKNALTKYKTIVNDRLSRLFEGTSVNIQDVSANVTTATTFDQVSAIYFDGVRGVTPNTNHKTNELISTEGKRLVSQDIEFRIGKIQFDNEYFDDVMEGFGNIKLEGLIDKRTTYVKLSTDGYMTAEIHIDQFVYLLLQGMVSAIDLSQYDLDLSFLNKYVHELFPGNDTSDFSKLIESIENCLGIKIVGLDASDPKVKKLFDAIESGKMPDKIELPDDIHIEIKQPYELKHVDSLTKEGGYEAVYVGNYRGREPYFIMTLEQDEWEDYELTIVSEFLFLRVEMYQK